MTKAVNDFVEGRTWADKVLGASLVITVLMLVWLLH